MDTPVVALPYTVRGGRSAWEGWPMSETDPMRLATAYHEAGHCVVGLVTGEPPTKSSIVAGDNYEGCTWFEDEDLAALLVDDPPREASEWHVIRTFAGPIAEHRYTGDDIDLGACYGYAKAIELITRLSTDVDRLNASLVNRTEAILEEHWPAVERVAASLAEHLTVDGETIREVAHIKGGRGS